MIFLGNAEGIIALILSFNYEFFKNVFLQIYLLFSIIKIIIMNLGKNNMDN